METELINEKTDSISLSKNSRGYTWDLKIYTDNLKDKQDEVISELKKIDTKMQDNFKAEGK